MPTVSVIIPTHNRADMLKEAIESVRQQTFADWELIVVDDGSTDQTRDVVDACRTADGRIRYAWQPPQGVCAARNRGFGVATGEFIGFLDDDDLWLPNKLAVQVEYLRTHPAVGFVSCPMRVQGPHGRIEGMRPTHPFVNSFEALLIHNRIQSTTPLVRRCWFERVGGFDPARARAADYDLWLRLARVVAFASTTEPLAVYRIHGHNMTAHIDSQQHLEHVRIFQKLLADPTVQGTARKLVRERLTRELHLAGKACLSERRYAEAARAFLRELRLSPLAGSVFVTPEDRLGARVAKLLKPYLALGYAGLASVCK